MHTHTLSNYDKITLNKSTHNNGQYVSKALQISTCATIHNQKETQETAKQIMDTGYI